MKDKTEYAKRTQRRPNTVSLRGWISGPVDDLERMTHLTSLLSNASMDEMRRTGILLVAIGYSLAFVAVCLATCLMGPAVADHGCCPGDEGIRAADRDCCSVTPGVSHGGAQVAATLPTQAGDTPFNVAVLPLVARAPLVTVSTSPPLILRV
jgi:hypothetical protein